MYEEPGQSPLFLYYGYTARRPLLIPSEKFWATAVPAWAASKRSEILERIFAKKTTKSFIEYSDEATKEAWIREPKPPII
jgi:hypothetical protein